MLRARLKKWLLSDPSADMIWFCFPFHPFLFHFLPALQEAMAINMSHHLLLLIRGGSSWSHSTNPEQSMERKELRWMGHGGNNG